MPKNGTRSSSLSLAATAKLVKTLAKGLDNMRDSNKKRKASSQGKRRTRKTLKTVMRDSRSGKKFKRTKKVKAPKIKSISNRVKDLEKRQKKDDREDRATTINYITAVSQIVCTAGNCVYADYAIGTRTQIIALMNKIRLMEVDSALTDKTQELTVALGTRAAAGPFTARVGLTFTTTFMFRNNWNIPCIITVYEYEVKDDTALFPSGAANSEANNIGIGTYLTNVKHSMNLPFRSTFFHTFFSKKDENTVRLEAGDEYKLKVTSGRKEIAAEDIEDRTSAHLSKLTRMVTVRVQGVVSHEKLTTGNVGYGNGTVDVIEKKVNVVDIEGFGSYKKVESAIDDVTALTTPVVYGPNVVELEEQG